jgi:hypothetical protein
MTLRKLKADIANAAKAKTHAIIVGDRYFMSDFFEREGAFVIVKSKSTEINAAGWPSTVQVEVVEPVGYTLDFDKRYYGVGTLHNVNASNLYTDRALAAQHIVTAI